MTGEEIGNTATIVDHSTTPRWFALVIRFWSFLVVHFTELVAQPLYDVGDDAQTKHRKDIFSYASVFYMLEAAAIVAIVFGVQGFSDDDDCGSFLGFAAIMGFLITMFLYAYTRFQQTCYDVVIAFQFLQTSLQQYVFVIFVPSSNACVGAIGMIAASLLYAACRIPVHYHIAPVLASLFVFASTIADVTYSVGVSGALCERDVSAAIMLPVAAVMMAQFYAVVGMTSVSTFVVSLYKDEDMRGFFSLRMANVVLGLVAGLNFDIANRVLAVCMADISEDFYSHFQKIVKSIQRYTAYVPPSVLRPTAVPAAAKQNDSSLILSGMFLASQQRSSEHHNHINVDYGVDGRGGPSTSGGLMVNPLSTDALRERSPPSPLQGEGDNELDEYDAAGQMIANLFSNHRGSGASSTAQAATILHNFHGTQRIFESKSGTVLRVSFSLTAALRRSDGTDVVRDVMVQFVNLCGMYHGEIEETTSTFVLISFGVRFHIALHQQVAVDCGVALYRALTAHIFKPNQMHVAVVSGDVTWGTYVTTEKSFVVIGGFPVELATKLNSLQEQLQVPFVATTDTVSHCRHSFIPVDLCRPVGSAQSMIVFELLLQDDATEETKRLMSEAVVGLQKGGERAIPNALDILVSIKEVCPQAARLARLLSKLPQDVDYCKDEVPWVSNADQVIAYHPILQGAVLHNNSGVMSPDGQPHSLLDNSVYGLLPPGGGGGGFGDTASMASVSTRHGPVSLFGGEDDDDDDINGDATPVDPLVLQQWTLGPPIATGSSCGVVIALGSSGNVGAAVMFNHLDSDHQPRELFLYAGGGRIVQKQIARMFAVVTQPWESRLALYDLQHPPPIKRGGKEKEEAWKKEHALWEKEKKEKLLPDTEQLLVVMEHFPQGNLRQFLQDYKGATMRPMLWVNYVREIMRGAYYLHNSWKLVHGCIRPSCVLIGDDSRVALTKYGLVPPHKGHPDHVFYAAPELVLMDSKKRKQKDVDVLTPALDVWSIGITAIELTGCQNPIRTVCNNDPSKVMSLYSSKRGLTQAALSDQIRTLLRGAPTAMVDFILRCVVIDSQDRMGIRDAHSWMEGINISLDNTTS
ncbi:protein kinase, putative [Bodo saltans]|uniref:Protein kinase, putative n=1 Tax=Bodo saltans TaxID=75058 RepID=A0A0S4IPT0_BODSA|nr:protein kinase, putative [Bodo saltans]|eukprot:CUF06002.1 protein kinase, putative [Bodo saltans]